MKEYQVDLDPNKLAAYGIPLSEVVSKIRVSNNDVGGKTFEVSSTEYYVRGRGYIKSLADIEDIPLKVDHGTPVYVRNVGSVHFGPDLRRGVAELNGKGETVGGIVVMRYGENALTVIEGIKKKLKEIAPSLPPGVKIVPTYDRSGLIGAAIATLREKLLEECIIVALVCLVFLWHVRSALVAVITLPIAIVLSFAPMHALGLSSSIMSLGGIAIAIGAMVDAAIIMVENAHKQLNHFREGCRPRAGSRWALHRDHHRSRPQRGPPALLLAPRDHGELRAGVLPGRAGGQAVQAAGVHEDLCHGVCGAPGDHARAGADDDARARPDRPGDEGTR